VTVTAEADEALVAGARRIADEVAAGQADDVDRQARFPAETVDALRGENALAAAIPAELGGAGASLPAVAAACFELGRRCGSSGMVFAMHQIQVLTIARHATGSEYFEEYLRAAAGEQPLIASVTSEVSTGGDLGSSTAAVTPDGDGRVSFEKAAPTVSYGSQADDLLTTLRRAPDAEPGEQVLVLSRRDQTTLEPAGTWDPLGMRGTCSPGFVVRAGVPAEQVLPTPFDRISAESMVPISHILWSHVWLGIATDAFDRARAFVRAAARRKPGQTPSSALRLSKLMSELSLLRAEVSSSLDAFERLADNREALGTMAVALRFNNLKIAASEQAPRVCHGALDVTGIMGFKNDTPFSVGRHLRDSMSGSLMVANERIHQINAGLLLIAKDA
jgi:acyl-CoA dehydrogenase